MGKQKQQNVIEAETPATVANETIPVTAAPVEVPTPETPVVLYSSERGEIACKDHAPHKGTDTWRFDRWRKMKADEIVAFECELGHMVACEVCRQAKEGAPPAEQAAEPQSVEVEAEAPKKRGRKSKADLTLGDLAERYVAHLEESGKSAGTSASYGLELKTAISELGAETKLAELKPEQVLAYFGSNRVLRKKNGKQKSPLSIAKTQRVLRLALVWAVEKKLIAKAPLPEDLATH